MSEIILSFQSAEKFLGDGTMTWGQFTGALRIFVMDTKVSIFDLIQACSGDQTTAGKKRMSRILNMISICPSLLSYCLPGGETLEQTLERLSKATAINVNKLAQKYHLIVGVWATCEHPPTTERVRLLGLRQALESFGYKVIA